MENHKRGILVVSFGTSYPESLKSCIESTENNIKHTLRNYEIRRAFTSNMIIKKLKERDNLVIDTPMEALQHMMEEGFKEVIVQPLHIMFGDEYEKIENSVEFFRSKGVFETIEMGRPLLFNNKDYEIAAEALKTQLPILKEDTAILLMAHGTSHPANASYFQLEYVLRDLISENIFVSTVEGYPLIQDIIPKLVDKKIKQVILMPFMLVAGDHANNDMVGEEEDSWRNLLLSEGIEVLPYVKGLGENIAFQNIYVQHIKDCIEKNKI